MSIYDTPKSLTIDDAFKRLYDEGKSEWDDVVFNDEDIEESDANILSAIAFLFDEDKEKIEERFLNEAKIIIEEDDGESDYIRDALEQQDRENDNDD